MGILPIPKLKVLLATEIPIIPRFSYLFVAQKNFLNLRWKLTLLKKKPLLQLNIPFSSKYFYEYVFLI